MFSKAHQPQTETEIIQSILPLITEREGICYISHAVLRQRNIDYTIIENILNTLGLFYQSTEGNLVVFLEKNDLISQMNPRKPSAQEPQTSLTSQKPAASTDESTVRAVPSPANSSYATQIQQILQQCQTQHRGPKPLFAGPQQETMLINYIRASFLALEPKKITETPAQFMTRTRALNAEKVTIQRAFTEQFSSEIALDELNDPAIFLMIKTQLKQIEKQNKIQRIHSVFPYTVEHLASLSDPQLQQIYLKTIQVDDTLNAARTSLDYFIERAGQPQNTIQISTQINNPRPANDPSQNITVILTAPNEAIAYSIHNLLVIAGILPNQPFAGNPSKRYEDSMTFNLTYEQFKVLQTYLGDLSVWYRDFENILSSLFDTDAAQYIKTGCKPVREAVRTETVRQQNGDAPLMNADVRARFAHHMNDSFLLLGQAAIDLTHYPHREDMRALLQSIYAQCGLKDSKNEAKTFVRDEADQPTFISLLSVGHIRLIYDEIMALSTLTKAAKDAEFTLFDYISILGMDSGPKGLYHTYLQLLLTDIMVANTPVQRNETATVKRRKIEASVTAKFPFMQGESFTEMQKRFQKAVQNILNETMNIHFRTATIQIDREPTDAEKHALISSSPFSGQLSFQISNHTVVDHTITKLKASPNYATLANAYTHYFQSLGAHARVNHQRFNAEYIYMYPTLDECIDNLGNQLKTRQNSDELEYAKQAWLNIVKKVVYAQKMHISETALSRTAERMADIFKVDHGRDDLGQGCNTGLSGRMLLIDSQLVSGEDNVFMQFNRQFLIDQVEQSFNDTIGSSNEGESSMAARAKPVIMAYTGLQANTTGRNSTSAGNIPQFMKDLATRYNPGKIYEECYKYVCDEFKRCIRESDDEAMQALLASLGFNPETEAELFQIDAKWNIKRFEVLLPGRLISLLQGKNLIQPGTGQMVIEADRSNYSFIAAINEKQTRLQNRSTARNPQTLFASSTTQQQLQRPPVHPQSTTPAPTNTSTWAAGGLYRPANQPTQQQTVQNEVDLRGDSTISTNPGTGSTG